MSDLVVMTNKNLPDQPIAVPEEAVEGHKFYGWRVANKSLQADAEAIAAEAAPDPVSTAKKG